MATASARVTQVVLEAAIPVISRSPTTPTGAGVTQVVLEAAFLRSATKARVTQVVVEALVQIPGGNDGSGGGGGGGGGGSHAWGSPG